MNNLKTKINWIDQALPNGLPTNTLTVITWTNGIVAFCKDEIQVPIKLEPLNHIKAIPQNSKSKVIPYILIILGSFLL